MLQYLFVFSYLTDGFAYAAEALVGKFIGSRNQTDLKRLIKLLFLWGFYISIPFTLAYIFAGDFLMYIITDNEIVIAAASPYMFWIGLVPIVTFAAFIWDGVYIGATSSAPMRNTLLISTIFVFLPSYFLLREPLGNHGLWLALMLFMISRAILLTLYSKKNIFNMV